MNVFEIGLGIAVSLATVDVAVHDGTVTLRGEVEYRSQLSLVEQMARHIDGVVGVDISMTYRHDDTHNHLPPPMFVDITHEPWRD
jgi:hypothetical protein